MKLVKRKKASILAQCENCGRELDIPYTNTDRPHMPTIELKAAVQCPCGEYHNLIVDIGTSATKTPRVASKREVNDQSLKCPRCGSTQLHAGDKGFGLGKATAGYLLAGPVGGVFGGLLGHKKAMITCLKCGHKWPAGKQL